MVLIEPSSGPADPVRPQIDALIRELVNTVDIARALLEAGRTVDLSGLEHRAGLLCAKVLDLPPAEGRAVRLHLIGLLGLIDALSQALATRAPWRI